MNNGDEISQAEKRRILAEERRMRTYHGHAMDADLEMGGRYSRVNTTKVVGSGPISYPQQPAGSPWAKDECPPEPLIAGRGEGNVLGYEIDRPDAATAPLTAAAPDVGGVSGGPSGGDVSATSFNKPSRMWRRF